MLFSKTFRHWFQQLEEVDASLARLLASDLAYLAAHGRASALPTVRHRIQASRHFPNLAEVRTQHGDGMGPTVRVLVMFHGDDVIVVLVGGDKSRLGNAWYEQAISIARWVVRPIHGGTAMSDLEFSTTSADGETFDEIDPRHLSTTPGFADAVEAGLADRERTHNLLAALRLAAGITQDEAAAAWGRAQPHVSRLERLDLRVAQVNTIASYVNALGGSLHLTIELRGARFDVPIAADAAIDPAA